MNVPSEDDEDDEQNLYNRLRNKPSALIKSELALSKSNAWVFMEEIPHIGMVPILFYLP